MPEVNKSKNTETKTVEKIKKRASAKTIKEGPAHEEEKNKDDQTKQKEETSTNIGCII